MLKFLKEFQWQYCIEGVAEVQKVDASVATGRVKMPEKEEQGQSDCIGHGSVFAISEL